ncbi:MAG: PIN domain-containing protein, partial [Gammaproteobacteria bacterium]|nr:type II toxin-antitoxin system VapC family toxin [Gemmatimonadota bacterium]NIU75383.1 PIN domain-containing protein [Gammaproteobacteria bacterium]
MRFWDTSAIVPLLLEQEATAEVAELLASDPEIVVWWGTP